MERLEKLRRGLDLTFEEAAVIFNDILNGEKEEVYVEELLLLLADKGEKEQEIAACAEALLQRATAFRRGPLEVLDIVGTGGDGSGSFNISSAAAIVCSIFVPVAKHGNRAVSSKSGSADFLEALNVPIGLGKEGAEQSLKEKNFAFLFAQIFHPAMKSVASIRKKIGKRTIFNLLGPLCNPARPENRLIGVFDARFIPTYVSAADILGIQKALIVSGLDGMDEVSLSDRTRCCLKDGSRVKSFEFDPRDFRISAPKGSLNGFDPETNARIAREVFRGEHEDLMNGIAINAAFGLMVAGVEEELRKAFLLAKETMRGKKAYEKLMELAA